MLHTVITILKWAFLAMSALLFIRKVLLVRRFKAKYGRSVRPFYYWYTTIDIHGTSSATRRVFMQDSNLYSMGIVACLGASILLFVLGKGL